MIAYIVGKIFGISRFFINLNHRTLIKQKKRIEIRSTILTS